MSAVLEPPRGPAAAAATPAKQPLPASRAEVRERAAALVSGFRARAAQAEELRRVPDDSIAELREAGLFRILTPRRFGGAELGLAALVDAAIELSRGCVSTGWVYGNLTGHFWILSQFPVEAQEQVYADPDAICSTLFRLGGAPPERVPGGYRVRGALGKWCSGIDHAAWVFVGTAPVGEPARFFMVPRADLEIVDDWHTSGMRGTGSKSILIKDAFVPDALSINYADAFRGISPGGQALGIPLFRLPMPMVLPMSLLAAPVGAALAAVDLFAAFNGKRLLKANPEEQAVESALFARLGDAAATIDAAHALIVRDAEASDAVRDPAAVPPLQMLRVSRNSAYVAQTCRRAVNSLIEASGGSTIYNTSEIQRVWRDINGVCGHVAFGWDGNMTSYGRAVCGLPPSKFERKGGK